MALASAALPPVCLITTAWCEGPRPQQLNPCSPQVSLTDQSTLCLFNHHLLTTDWGPILMTKQKTQPLEMLSEVDISYLGILGAGGQWLSPLIPRMRGGPECGRAVHLGKVEVSTHGPVEGGRGWLHALGAGSRRTTSLPAGIVPTLVLRVLGTPQLTRH